MRRLLFAAHVTVDADTVDADTVDVDTVDAGILGTSLESVASSAGVSNLASEHDRIRRGTSPG